MKSRKISVYVPPEVIGEVLSHFSCVKMFWKFYLSSKIVKRYIENENPFCCRHIEFPLTDTNFPILPINCRRYVMKIKVQRRNLRHKSFDAFPHFFSLFSNLVHLILVNCFVSSSDNNQTEVPFFDDRIFAYLQKLKVLDITDSTEITGKGFQYLPDLEVLILRNRYRDSIHPRENLKFLRSLKQFFILKAERQNLDQLDFGIALADGNEDDVLLFGSEHMKHLPQKRLEVFYVKNAGFSKSVQVDVFVELRKLVILNCGEYSQSDFSSLKQLRELKIDDKPQNPRQTQLVLPQSLVKLTLFSFSKISEQTSFRGMGNLKTLKLYSCKNIDVSTDTLKNMKSLEVLIIEKWSSVVRLSDQEEITMNLGALLMLRFLSIVNKEIKADVLTECKSLEILKIKGCYKGLFFNVDSMRKIRSKKLKRVTIYKCGFGEEDFESLSVVFDKLLFVL